MSLIYNLLSGICVTIAVTGLLTKKLKWKQNLILVLYVAGMAWISAYTGQIIGILMIVILFLLIFLMESENRIQNVFLAGIGYVINLVFNNVLLMLLATVFKIPTSLIIEKYWFIFSVGYAGLLWCMLYYLKKALGSKLNIQSLFTNTHRATQYSLLVNLVLYIVIFLVNISLGEKTGYSAAALRFNSILFAICFAVSSKVIIECTKGIETEEKRKAEIQQQKLLENYVNNLEQMIDEMRAFRHDYKNMLSTMAGFIRENQMEELKEYFYDKTELPVGDSEMQAAAWKYLRNIMPMELKGFLYEKMLLIFTRNIQVRVNITNGLDVKYSDMKTLIRILGIFIDNAVEEAEKLTEGFVEIEIVKTKLGVLFCIKNNYDEKPEIGLMAEKGYSTKGKDRGMGLYWAQGMLDCHKDMFHELLITEKEVIQRVEIIVK